MSKRALRRLNVLQTEAEQTPVPTRKFFHVGKPELMEDVGECIPMLSWVDDNLSRYVLSDAASSSWSADSNALIIALPNIAVAQGDGVFLIAGRGADESVPNPNKTGGPERGRMHFVHLGLARGFAERRVTKLYIYRLEGVQMKAL